tara:strand:- start:74 stop:244 length:171 start_codon:yes stop_codon:yes gene_type:complete
MIELMYKQESVINQIEHYLEIARNKETATMLKKAKAEAITTRATIRRLSKMDFGEV